MDKQYTMEEIMQGFAASWELNKSIEKDLFEADVKAEFITYENL